MANYYVTLDTENQRVKWFKAMITNLEEDSRFARYEGSGVGNGTILRETDEKAGHTFYVEDVGVASGVPLGYDSRMIDTTVALNFSANTGYRAEYAFAMAARKFTQAGTPRQFKPSIIFALRKHFARIYDSIIVSALSAYPIDLSTSQTTATLLTVYNPSLAANITALAAILNVQYIGHADAASSAGLNVFFAGEADGGGPRTKPPINSYNDAKANPQNYLLREQDFANLRTYSRLRGVPSIDLTLEYDSDPPYILFLPSSAIDEVRATSAYKNFLQSGDISSREMWDGKMRVTSIHGIILQSFDNPYPFDVLGITDNTLLRVCDSDDGKYLIVEGLLVGAQAGAVDSYDDFQVMYKDLDFPGREPGIGYSVIKGAVAVQRVDTNTTTPVRYNNTVSFIFATRKWA